MEASLDRAPCTDARGKARTMSTLASRIVIAVALLLAIAAMSGASTNADVLNLCKSWHSVRC
jgi:hypothetical protein